MRPASALLPEGESWVTATEKARQSDAGVPIAWVPSSDERLPTRGRATSRYYEAVPYLLVLESVERAGRWLRRAEHPELPGCAAEADIGPRSDRRARGERADVLRQLWERGEPIPVPRPPLRAGAVEAGRQGPR